MTLTGLTDERAVEALSNPGLLRLLTSPVGQFMPAARIGTSVIVTRFADVVEVFERDDIFHVSEIYAPAMARTTGVFVLGMDDRERYQREAMFLRSAVHANDTARIGAIVADEAADLLRGAAAAGRIDVASGYAHKLALAVVAKYFGVTGPDPETMGRWMRSIFWDIFFNITNRRDVTEAAMRDGAELSAYLDRKILGLRVAFERTGEVPDHFLGRLVLNQREHGMDDVGVRRNIAGVIVGAVDTVSKTIVNVIDELLRRPAQLALAQMIARADDQKKMGAYSFEALRFNPHNSALLRHCATDYVLARGSERESHIAAGSKVYASLLSAMQDPSVLISPDQFRIDRPWDHYLHFGRGIHRCFGERFNRVSVPRAVSSLLRLGKLRRAPGPEGRLRYDGPFPTHLIVQFDSSG